MTVKRLVLVLSLLWLTGVAIRIPILVIPPIIPYIRTDLNMSGTAVGALSGVPMIILALLALPGSALVNSVGALRAILLGLLITGVGGAVRGMASTTEILLLTTAITGVGIAICQPALPVVVRQWVPSRIGLGTAVYSNGLVAGCIFPAFMTLTLVMPALNNDWRLDLLVWSLPVFASFVLLLCLAPKDSEASRSSAGPDPSRKFDFSLVWRIGLMFGANNCVYFGTNAFLPPYFIETGYSNLVTEGLSVFNFMQVPGSLAVLMFAKQMERRRWPYICGGFGLVFGLGWIATSSGNWTLYAATMLGFFNGITLATGLMLPPLLSKPSEVARVAAAMFTVSYTAAMISSVLGGAMWDLFDHPRFAFFLLVIFALPLIIVTPLVSFEQKLHAR